MSIHATWDDYLTYVRCRHCGRNLTTVERLLGRSCHGCQRAVVAAALAESRRPPPEPAEDAAAA